MSTVGRRLLIALTVLCIVSAAAAGGMFLATKSQVEQNQTVSAAGYVQQAHLTNGSSDPAYIAWDSTANLTMNMDDFNADEILVRTTLIANTVAVTDNVTVTGGVDIVGALEVTGTVDLKGVVSSNGSNILRLNENTVVTGTLDVSGAETVGGALSVTGIVSTPNSVWIADNLIGDSQDGVLRYSTGYFTKTLDTNAISVTSGITGATLALSGAANITGAITTAGVFSSTGNVFNYGNLYGTKPAGSLTYGAGVFTSTLAANTLQATDAVTVGGGLGVTGLASLGNGVKATGAISLSGSILDTSGTGSITMNSGAFTSTLAANTLSTTDAITAGGTLRSVGIAYLEAGVVTSTLSANTLEATNNLTVAGSIDLDGDVSIEGNIVAVASDSQSLTFGTGAFTSTLAANTVQATDAITAGGTLRSVGTAYLQGAEVTATLKVGTFLQYTSGVTQSVITTQPITPTATYMQIAANDGDGCFTDNLVRAGALTGQLWILQNIGVPTITITDANTCNLASTYAMAISDTLTLIFDGTSWVEIGRSNN